MNQLDLKEIERRVQRSFYQDGLLELGAGIYMLLVGLIINNALSTAFLPFLILGFKPIMEALKRRLIYPRIGYVKFREEETVDSKSFGFGVIALVVLAVASPFISILILGKGPGWEFWTRRFLPFFTGFIASIGFIFGAHTYRTFRWYALAVVCIVAGLGVPYLGLESIYTPIAIEFQIIGGVAFLTGLVMFVLFLLKHPVDKQLLEPGNESG